MTGITAKSTMLNTGDGKTVFGAWPSHDSDRQDDRLGGVSHQLCNSQSEPKSKKTWRSTLDDLTVSQGDPNGECRTTHLTKPLPQQILGVLAYFCAHHQAPVDGRSDGHYASVRTIQPRNFGTQFEPRRPLLAVFSISQPCREGRLAGRQLAARPGL